MLMNGFVSDAVTCRLVCPLGAIRLDKAQKKMVKCDLCQGEEIPAYVADCPNEA